MDNQSSSSMPMVGLFKSLSLYLPLILMSSLLIFSIMSGSLQKFLFYVVTVLLIIMLRLIIVKSSNTKGLKSASLPSDCSIGLINKFIPEDVLFSTYLMSFTLFYFLTPMILLTVDSGLDSINYIIILFFLCYIFLDLAMKKHLGCTRDLTNVNVAGNFFSGTLLGAGISSLLYTSPIKNLLYIGEINSENEVCSMPSKQKFKCRVYKNGELVGSTVS
jgi:hypothetical protein